MSDHQLFIEKVLELLKSKLGTNEGVATADNKFLNPELREIYLEMAASRVEDAAKLANTILNETESDDSVQLSAQLALFFATVKHFYEELDDKFKKEANITDKTERQKIIAYMIKFYEHEKKLEPVLSHIDDMPIEAANKEKLKAFVTQYQPKMMALFQEIEQTLPAEVLTTHKKSISEFILSFDKTFKQEIFDKLKVILIDNSFPISQTITPENPQGFWAQLGKLFLTLVYYATVFAIDLGITLLTNRLQKKYGLVLDETLAQGNIQFDAQEKETLKSALISSALVAKAEEAYTKRERMVARGRYDRAFFMETEKNVTLGNQTFASITTDMRSKNKVIISTTHYNEQGQLIKNQIVYNGTTLEQSGGTRLSLQGNKKNVTLLSNQVAVKSFNTHSQSELKLSQFLPHAWLNEAEYIKVEIDPNFAQQHDTHIYYKHNENIIYAEKNAFIMKTKEAANIYTTPNARLRFTKMVRNSQNDLVASNNNPRLYIHAAS